MKYMQDLKAIKIIHGISDRIDFLFLAEFLRLCGFFHIIVTRGEIYEH
jgi:hypothetical protein